MFVTIFLVSTANSSDSEELSAGESVSKSQSAKSVSTGMKSHQTKSLTRTQSPGKCGKNGEKESDLKEQNNRLPKVYKWSFQMCKYFLQNPPSMVLWYSIRRLLELLNSVYFGCFFFPLTQGKNYIKLFYLSLLNFVINSGLKFLFFFFLPLQCSKLPVLQSSVLILDTAPADWLFLSFCADLSLWHECSQLCTFLALIFCCWFTPHFLVIVQTHNWFVTSSSPFCLLCLTVV